MKKQILILTLFVAAILVGTTSAFAQVDDAYLDAAVASCPVPAVLNCGTAGALSPLPGEIYTYDIDFASGENPGSTVHWFVTTDVNVIASAALTTSVEAAGGTYVLSAGTTANGGNASYDDGANTGDILEVAWNYFDPTTTVLLVAFVVDATGCTNNVEVYKIEPIFNFVLEIEALEDNGVIQDPAASLECVSPVQSATFDGTNLVMDYGDNYIYYIVSAANWVHSWDPTFTAPTSPSTGGSTVGTVEWAYADEAHLAATVWNTDATPVEASHWGLSSVGADGQCIVLRVNIDHSGANEMITSQTFTAGVDGVMYDSSTSDYTNGDLADLDDDGSGGCINTVTDEADYIITPRPDVNAEDPTPFVPKN